MRETKEILCPDRIRGLTAAFNLEQKFVLPYGLPLGQKFDAGAHEKYLGDLAAILARNPKNAGAWAKKGRVHFVLGDFPQALSCLNKSLRLAPAAADSLLWRAEASLATGRETAGLRDLRAASRAGKRDPRPRLAAAAHWILQGDFKRALAQANAAQAACESVAGFLLRGCARARSGDWERAAKDFRGALALDARAIASHLLLSRALARAGKDMEAAAAMDEALRLDPDAKMHFGTIFSPQGILENNERGLADLDRYLQKHPEAAWAWCLRGDMLRTPAWRQTQQGLKDLNHAVELAPSSPWILAHLARAHVQEIIQPEHGMRLLNKAVNLDPGCAWLVAWRAEAHRQMGERDKSVRDFRKSLAMDPDRPQTHAWLGRVFGDAEQWGRAITEYDRAIAIDPAYGFAYVKRAEALAALARHEQAVADFSRALNLKFPHKREWVAARRGRSLLACGDVIGAVNELERCIRQNPALCWFPLAAVAKGKKRAEALRIFQALDETLQQNPNLGSLFAWRGMAHWALGDIQRAASDLNHAVAADSSFAWALAWRGRLRWRAGEIEGGLRDIEEALARDGGCAWLWAWRAEIRLGMGDRSAAAQDAERALSLYKQSAAALYVRGEIRRLEGQAELAARDLDAAVSADPGLIPALVSRAMLRASEQNYAGQIADLRKVADLDPDLIRRQIDRIKDQPDLKDTRKALEGLLR